MNPTKKIINGDYYQLTKNGDYQKHNDVAVHCHDDENQVNPQQYGTHSNCDFSFHSNDKKEQSSTELLTPRMPFTANCTKILEKEEVASIHQEDSQEEKNIKNNYQEKIYDQNYKMSRSTQNNLSPKKGILKRSMADNKYDTSPGKKIMKNQMMNRSVRIDNLQFHINKEEEHKRKLQHEYEMSMQRLRSLSSEVQEQQKVQRNLQYRGINTRLQYQQIPSIENERQFYSNVEPNVREGLQSMLNRVQNRANQIRNHTQGMDTVVNSSRRSKRYAGEQREYTVNMHQHDEFSSAVFNQLVYLKNKLSHLEQELTASEHRMKSYTLQQQLKQKQAQMAQMRKQNDFLKEKESNQNIYHHQSNSALEIPFQFNVDFLKNILSSKIYLAFGFVLLLLTYLIFFKGSGQCSAKQ